MQFNATKTWDKLSVNIDHVYCKYSSLPKVTIITLDPHYKHTVQFE